LRLFLEIARRSFNRQLTYRAAIIAGLITNLFFGLVRAAVLVGLYGEEASVAGMSLSEAVTYTGVSQALIVFLGLFGWWDLMNAVYRGDIAADLLKPMGLYSFWMAQEVGRALVDLFIRASVILGVYALAFGLDHPESSAQWLALILSIALAWLLSFAFRFTVNLASFWSPDARGIGRLAFVIAMFGYGILMPVRFYPPAVQEALAFTPFPHMLNTTLEIYLGTLHGPELVWVLVAQGAWALALTLAAQWLLGRAARRLVIQGG
jgi:ABC-2 type transport system permease protein